MMLNNTISVIMLNFAIKRFSSLSSISVVKYGVILVQCLLEARGPNHNRLFFRASVDQNLIVRQIDVGDVAEIFWNFREQRQVVDSFAAHGRHTAQSWLVEESS